MSLAPSGSRGKYLALWIVARNLGQLVGGAIKYIRSQVKAIGKCNSQAQSVEEQR